MPAAAENEEEVEVMHIDTGDMVKVKQVLDEAAMTALTEMDYVMDHFSDNAKLAVMVIACTFAMVAQFYPMPFPESRALLAVCCAGYFLFSSILQLIATFHDKDTIMFIKPNIEVTGSDKSILLKSKFPRFEETYKLGITLDEPGAKLREAGFYIGDYFDRDGNFAEDLFVQAVQKQLVQVFEEEQTAQANKKDT